MHMLNTICLSHKHECMWTWFEHPTTAYIESYFRFYKLFSVYKETSYIHHVITFNNIKETCNQIIISRQVYCPIPVCFCVFLCLYVLSSDVFLWLIMSVCVYCCFVGSWTYSCPCVAFFDVHCCAYLSGSVSSNDTNTSLFQYPQGWILTCCSPVTCLAYCHPCIRVHVHL